MLKSADVGFLLYLLLYPEETFAHMAALLGVSKSTAHAGVARLEKSGLVHRLDRRGALAVARGPALEFLQFGVPYVYRAETVPKARGVPTGLAALATVADPDAPEATMMVWPSQLGDALGVGVKPLVPAAPDTSLRDPRLYHLLAIVDVLRTGDARERGYARNAMRRAFEQVVP